MSKTIYTLCLMVLFTFLSCKDEAKTTEQEKPVANTEKTIQLSNYSDQNWAAGVGKEFNMFLADNTKDNEALIKSAKELQLSDGSIVKVTGYTVADPFIQINIEGKASDYKDLAGHPNTIVIR